MSINSKFTLTKAALARVLYDRFGLSLPESTEFVDQFFEEIRSALESGHLVKLSGFGSFVLRDKSERPGRNPKTGEDVPITARRVVTFKVGQKFKALIKGRELSDGTDSNESHDNEDTY